VTAPDRLAGQIVPVKVETAGRNSLAGVLELETA
jgi:tRNA-2-methylthio-N6-dimethylallyladenosine synthase